MRGPERLLETERGLGQRLLEAGSRKHRAPAGTLERTLFRLGAASVVGAGMAGQAAAKTGAVAQLSTAVTSTAKGATATLTLIKAITAGTCIGLGSMAVLARTTNLLEPAGHEQSVTPTLRVGIGSNVRIQQSVEPRHTESPALPAYSAEVSSVSAPTAAASATASAAPSRASDVVSLAAEVRLIEKAEAALHRGAVDEALLTLDRHHAAFAEGQLRPEAA
ncbi:MAG: hypothetical protein ACM3ZE_12015, partial [Myxococcales bacterium]